MSTESIGSGKGPHAARTRRKSGELSKVHISAEAAGRSTARKPRTRSKEWTVQTTWTPPRPIKTPELFTARKLFFDLDRDNSGAVEASEIRQMLEQLGQLPSDEDIKDPWTDERSTNELALLSTDPYHRESDTRLPETSQTIPVRQETFRPQETF